MPRHLVAILFACNVRAFSRCHRTTTRNVGWIAGLSSTKDTSGSDPQSQAIPAFSCNVAGESLSREEGRSVVNRLLLPTQDYDKRSNFARDAQGVTTGSLLTADDPVLSMAYGEFPLESLDALLDLALSYRAGLATNKDAPTPEQDETDAPYLPLKLVDLGSGCGRLVFYMSLTRGGLNQIPWNVQGIEIANELHEEALRSVERGIEAGWFQSSSTDAAATEPSEIPNSDSVATANTFSLHLGPVADFSSVLGQAQVLFAYSSVFNTCGFSEELCAMLLDPSWSQMLAERCQPGCVAITTDRVLDPRFGWKLLGQKSVDNREIFGSIGYIQVLT